MTDQEPHKSFEDVVSDIEQLKGMTLNGINENSESFVVEDINKTSIKCDDGSSIPMGKVETLWDNLFSSGLVQATKVLGESGSHRSRPETILANLPYVKYYKVGNAKYIVFTDEDSHKLGTKEKMSKEEYEQFLKHPVSRTITYDTNYHKDHNFEYNRIVFGAPGTGKSYKVSEDVDSVIYDASHNQVGGYERVTFYSDYSYAKFVGSYRPTADKDGKITYTFTPGPFMRLLAEAYKSSLSNAKPYILIIEEINRADAAAVFGDVFQLLDRTSKGISQYGVQIPQEIRKYLADEVGGNPDDYPEIKLPNNMFIWATMNSADQGVFPLDTAFKRRWDFDYIGINDNEDKISDYNVHLGKGSYTAKYNWNALRKAINDILIFNCRLEEDKLIGPFFLNVTSLKQDSQGDILDDDRFIKDFKDKVLMYLFDDAGRMFRKILFPNAKTMMYSDICKAFEEQGPEIFGPNFDRYYQRER